MSADLVNLDPDTNPLPYASRGPLFPRVLAAVTEEPHSTAEDVAQDLGENVSAVSFALERLTDRGALRRSGERGAYTYRVPR